MPNPFRRSPQQAAFLNGHRSGLEVAIQKQLEALGVPAQYEPFTLGYVKPARKARYTPDFVLPNGIIIESKGIFSSEDRQKHKVIQAAYPGLDIRFVFSRSASRLNKKSDTTYAKWCVDYGFLYADKLIPLEWINEPVSEKRLSLINLARVS